MKVRGAVAVLSVFAVVLGAADQNPAPPAQTAASGDEPTRILVDVTRVNMLFTVTDKKGRFITDLNKDDFEVIEGKKPQVIQEFTAESDLPLRIGILIDTSRSIRDRFKIEQEAAIELLNSAIRSLRPGGGTSLYDAIFFACRDKLQQDQPKHKFRRALIVVSDGEDNQSRYTRDQALEMAQKADAVIYAISTDITRTETDGDKVLRYLTQETGGRAFFPFKVEDLAQSFENIANELRHQYNIFYRPEPLKTDGLYHTVDLRVKGRKDLIVRARKGYYAPKM